ncbi:type III pantothenate kinase [Paracrocinitomix mangrovi]|uniref:type III pantothenate kinase n=1 Tax=Paracrocinitomix mangrovi TaxID=2862509 RepID=UPI001C8E6187|nr:type III pantothenate kinase [Paracrocinitomix mangrovi]UKN00161.1 type III pantothenate kinase [Paracrocinitomix mangrovi]
MNLIIDEGNTAFKLALYQGDEILKVKSFKPECKEEMHSWISDSITSIKHAIVSSVVNDGLDLSRYRFNEIRLESNTPLPIKNLYGTPSSLGKDRIANAVGVWFRNMNHTNLVIDMGTCIKYDLVDAKGQYLGGNISPGIMMRFKALEHYTDKLPLLNPAVLEKDYGTDTESSIRAGVQLGAFNEINGFIRRYRHQFPELTIFMTGGDANFFDKPFIVDIFADSDLTLYGLNKILTYNVENT